MMCFWVSWKGLIGTVLVPDTEPSLPVVIGPGISLHNLKSTFLSYSFSVGTICPLLTIKK
jgi:hypothetical protein